ncbi:FKBP-type peptidyl-prolyl cis-trans isomerase [Longispora sp. NPDC051575]|uniref:FKBP-type peptidyl-prolyl cis-trans isomerase n=1 Tax=Longispora sp. NPDC051575 TaxID=3154943 RepID=UPI00341B0C8B
MGNPVTNPSEKSPANPRRVAKREAAARAVAAREAAERKRRVWIAGLSVLAVLVVVGGVLLLVKGGSDTKPNANPSASAVALDPALKTKPVVTAGTGTITELKVTPLVTGTGPETKAGQTISVNYVGVQFANGTEFDASWKRGQPYSFQLGAGGVIKGWDQGLVGVKVGSRVQLDIPSSLAYGDDPSSGRPTGTLRFVVDVLDAK